ncbi:unnamed protein product [Ambrosiozyma monospora]|uniref:Unnamed protein product n=1 Tax=Ambrosiozyma monospora TaxID=43982 RepID=A0A9W7DD46_AMBMO|nr:unnamed protein product [Ambrosiozyma monospora]
MPIRYILNEKINTLVSQSDIPQELKKQISENGWISQSDLIILYKRQQSQQQQIISDGTKKTSKTTKRKGNNNASTSILPGVKNQSSISLFELLQGAVFYKPAKVTKPKSKEYLKLMEKLRIQQQEREYQKLLKGTDPISQLRNGSGFNSVNANTDEYDTLTASQQSKQLKQQLTTIFNIFISVASVGYAVWYWSGSSMRLNDGVRILLCLFFSLLVLVAEVVMFGGYLKKIDDARIVERKKKEVKHVVETVTFSGDGVKRSLKNNASVGSIDTTVGKLSIQDKKKL